MGRPTISMGYFQEQTVSLPEGKSTIDGPISSPQTASLPESPGFFYIV